MRPPDACAVTAVACAARMSDADAVREALHPPIHLRENRETEILKRKTRLGRRVCIPGEPGNSILAAALCRRPVADYSSAAYTGVRLREVRLSEPTNGAAVRSANERIRDR